MGTLVADGGDLGAVGPQHGRARPGRARARMRRSGSTAFSVDPNGQTTIIASGVLSAYTVSSGRTPWLSWTR